MDTVALTGLHLRHLAALPNYIRHLDLYDNQLAECPELPTSLETLNIERNQLVELSELPTFLTMLIAGGNQLSQLPDLPASLEMLDVEDNLLTELPELPALLDSFRAQKNQLTELPTLPSSLRWLHIAENALTELPQLPPTLQVLDIASNRFTDLPELPASLQLLDVTNNQLTELPASMMRLPSTTHVHLTNNPLSPDARQRLTNLVNDRTYQGPRIYFGMHADNASSNLKRPLDQVVAELLGPNGDESAAKKWSAIGKEDNAVAFSAFLDQLKDVASAQKVPEFKEQITSWLTRLSDSPALRKLVFAVAMGATESCEDRVTLTWNSMQQAELIHRVECGEYDQRIPDLLLTGREMFRQEQLEPIAREKAKTLRVVDEIEVYLAFQTKLRDTLNLSSVAKEMRFFDVSGVTDDDLKAAELMVKTAESSQFQDWFSQWAPWHKVLARIAPERWEQASAKRLDALEKDYPIKVDAELTALGMKGDVDAERSVGVEVMSEIDKDIFGKLTRNMLADAEHEFLLKSPWEI